MTKQKRIILTSVALQDYYSGLTKKEKSQLLSRLVEEYGFSASTIQQKMSGQYDLKQQEVMLIGNYVINELWKR